MGSAASGAITCALEVLSGPLDGLRFEGVTSLVRIGRSEGAGPDGNRNDLVLERDSYSSSFHAELVRANDKWWFKDNRSTNGSWLGGRKLASGEQVELKIGQIFVAGNTVIRFGATPSGLPALNPNALAAASLAAQTMLNRARNLAKDDRVSWVEAGALFRVLAESDAAPLPEFFQKAGLDAAETSRLVNAWSWWRGELAWIENDILKKQKATPRAMRGIFPTPRVEMILTLADLARQELSLTQFEPVHLLLGLFKEGAGQVAAALTEAGHDPKELLALVEGIITPKSEDLSQRGATVRMAPLKPAPPPRRPVDAETWLLARDLMDRLQSAQSEFRLAEPAVRMDTLCGLIRDGIQKAPPAKRGAVFEQLYFLFPVLEEAMAPPPAALHEHTPHSLQMPAEPTTDHKGKTPPRGSGPAIEKAPQPGVDAIKMLQMLFSEAERLEDSDSGSGETPLLRFARYLYQFALDMERLAKGLVQSVQGGGGGGESRYILPFAVQDMKMYIQRLLQGDDELAADEVKRYLYDLGNWLIALIAAHQKATSQYHQQLWQRISPQAIRNTAKTSAINKALGLGKADLWQTYERVARDLSPEIAEDELNQKIGRIANEEFRRMSSGRT